MRKFGWILGANLQETVRFSKACDAIAGQICHILRTLEPAFQTFVKGLNRDNGPAFRLFLGLPCGFGAILTLFMGP